MNYDIAVAYRIYPKISKNPAVFPDDKYKLSELCLKSFKSSLGALRSKIWFILDNCPAEYKSLCLSVFDEKDLVFIEPKGVGNAATFGMQMDILSQQNDSEYMFFAEDDYFYLPDTFSEMLNLIKSSPDVHFVTPYDHDDYYNLKLHSSNYKIIYHQKRHWRTAASTCMTFLTNKKILAQSSSVFRTYTRNNYDSSLWMALTKVNIFKLSVIFHDFFHHSSYFKTYLKLFYHTFFQAFFGRKYSLYAPIPSLGTHLEKAFLAPGIDWNTEFQKDQ
ncbi:MAG: glycosyltransferase family 2 protein [Candidatus Kapabacteria bacterium]|nr:glycosyltransferase family 2 protein [Candidatus Kapabacteria bacterium]